MVQATRVLAPPKRQPLTLASWSHSPFRAAREAGQQRRQEHVRAKSNPTDRNPMSRPAGATANARSPAARAILPAPASCNRRRLEPLWRWRKWVACITDTNRVLHSAAPERRFSSRTSDQLIYRKTRFAQREASPADLRLRRLPLRIAELLPRPVERPSQKPLIEFRGFLYQGAS